MDIDLDLGLAEAAPAPAPASFTALGEVALSGPRAPRAPERASERAQAIDCDGLAVAVSYAQARSVIDDDTVAPVPNAPPWLAGAANIDGHLVAVVDLHTWADPRRSPPTGRARLLLCADGDERLALRFQGLPQMVPLLREGSPEPDAWAAPPASAASAALRPFCAGWAAEAAGADGRPGRRPLIDTAALARHWALQLAT